MIINRSHMPTEATNAEEAIKLYIRDNCKCRWSTGCMNKPVVFQTDESIGYFYCDIDKDKYKTKYTIELQPYNRLSVIGRSI